jgi:hypothetical protein
LFVKKHCLNRITAILVFTLAASLAATVCRAQAVPDTSLNNIIRDTVHERRALAGKTDTFMKPLPFKPNPKRAGLFSALLPGLGQVYNRQYWKVPIVAAGVGVAGYFYLDNLKQYQTFRKAYIGRINNPNPTDKWVGLLNEDQLKQYQDDYKKYLDMTVLFSTIGYALQVMDAITSAHLKNFDISRDISMRVMPVVAPRAVGLGLAVSF